MMGQCFIARLKPHELCKLNSINCAAQRSCTSVYGYG
jgi:hypothetical protein